MRHKRLASEIEALARRIESGSTAIGDFLRANVGVRLPEDSIRTLALDAPTFDALEKLSRAVRSGFREGDHTYGMLVRQLSIMYYGVSTGQLRGEFFARLGV